MADGQIGQPGIPVRTRVEMGLVSGHVPAATQYLNMVGNHVKDILTIPKLVIMGHVLVRKRNVIISFILNEAARNVLIQHTVINSILYTLYLLCFFFIFCCFFFFFFFFFWLRV